MNHDQLIADWLKHNKPSVTIDKPASRTPEEVEAALAHHRDLSAARKPLIDDFNQRSNAYYNNPLAKSIIDVTLDETTFNYGA